MIEKARMSDVDDIKKLLSRYARKGKLLDRNLVGLYSDLRDFFVARRGGRFIGCCALQFCWSDLAEIRSLAVKERYKKNSYGKKLVKACLEEARGYHVKRVFTLTFVPEFFEKLGFKKIKKSRLPHKIWSDCLNCVHFPKCKETALEFVIKQDE